MAQDGEILAEPLFWFQVDDRVIACFVTGVIGIHTRHKLEDARNLVIKRAKKCESENGNRPPSSAL